MVPAGLYAIPQVSPVSFLTLRRGRNNAEAVVTLRKGSGAGSMGSDPIVRCLLA